MDLLERLSFDVSVVTPDHFFSYLANLGHTDVSTKHIIDQARSSSTIEETLGKWEASIILAFLIFIVVSVSELLHNYPSSIVALSLVYTTTLSSLQMSDAFIVEQIKSFLQHKHKDPSHYFVSDQH